MAHGHRAAEWGLGPRPACQPAKLTLIASTRFSLLYCTGFSPVTHVTTPSVHTSAEPRKGIDQEGPDAFPPSQRPSFLVAVYPRVLLELPLVPLLVSQHQ